MRTEKTSCTIPLFPILSVLVALKFMGVITWPWIWVLAPLWIPFVLIVGTAIVIVGAWLVAGKTVVIRRTR